MVLVQQWPFFQLFVLGNIEQENVFYDILEQKTLFWAIKTSSLKSRKIVISLKGLTNGFGPKMAIFETFCFRLYRTGKCLLRYSRTNKTPFQAIKTRSSKRRKIDFFPKRLTHGFGRKMAIFPTFCFRQYRTRKCLLRYSRTKKRLSRL